MYSPTRSREELQVIFSSLRKLTYNKFRWWRMYDDPKPKLPSRSPLRDKILNGDFDLPHYKYQAEWVEHDINDIYHQYYPDLGRINEEISLLRSKRKRLLEDFEREENEKLKSLVKEFTQCFRCNQDQVTEEMLNCSGELIDLYYIIEEKYKITFQPYPRRGRPKKN